MSNTNKQRNICLERLANGSEWFASLAITHRKNPTRKAMFKELAHALTQYRKKLKSELKKLDKLTNP
jgi:hypothetical protein